MINEIENEERLDLKRRRYASYQRFAFNSQAYISS